MSVEQDKARDELWRRGKLSWLLDTNQKELYDSFYNSKNKITTWLLARRSGKTFLLGVLASEQCLSKPNSIVKFVSPTKTQLQQNVRPLFRKILATCPGDIRPEYNSKDSTYYFPNGSEIQLSGSESGHAEKLRGGDSDLWFVDEAGTCSDLRNIVRSILLPTTLTTNGRGVLASTPPKESEHDFLKYIEEAEIKGTLIKKTIDDNPRITEKQKEELFEELGGKDTEEARRELYCEILKDSKSAVIPEFDEILEKEIVREWPRPPFFDAYEGMDTGGKDLTVVLYAYYDFRAGKVIIEDETVINFQNKDNTIVTLTKAINKKELELWKNPLSLEYKGPFARISDIDYILIQEIQAQSKLLFPKEQVIHFETAKKDSLDTSINNFRILLSKKKIIISPKCKVLISHLKNVKWDKARNRFARSADEGHYDAVPAAIYLTRNIRFNKNPYPAHYDLNLKDLFVQNPEKYNRPTNQTEIYNRIFNIKSKRKF